MKYLFSILLFFSLHLIAAQDSTVFPKDTTKFIMNKTNIKELVLNSVFDCVRDANYSPLLDYCEPDLSFSYIKDSVVVKSQSVTNYKAVDILKNISQIANYQFFKIIDGFKDNDSEIIAAKLYRRDTDKESLINFYFILGHEGSVKSIVVEWSTHK